MNTVSIPLLGMGCSGADALSMDGEMSLLLNLQHRNKMLQPAEIPQPFVSASSPIVFVHATSVGDNWIGYNSTTHIVSLEYKSSSGGIHEVALPIATIEGVVELRAVDNILIVFASSGIEYLIYDQGAYSYLGKIEPDISPIIGQSYCMERTSSAQKTGRADSPEENNELHMNHINKLLYEAKEAGELTYPVLVRYAYRLYDDSYIHHSSPQLLMHYQGYNQAIQLSKFYNTNNNTSYYSYRVCGYQLAFSLPPDSYNSLKSIVKSIDLFIAPVTNLDFEESVQEVEQEVTLPFMGYEPYIQKLVEVNTFYRVAEIDVSQGLPEERERLIDLKRLLPNLEQQFSLPLDDLSHHGYSAGCSYVYNSRLHLGNIQTHLFKGHALPHFLTSGKADGETYCGIYNGKSYPLFAPQCYYIETYLKTLQGETRVVTSSAEALNYYAGLNPFVSYPDARAFKMVICILTSGNKRLTRTLPLTSSPSLNIAYYIEPSLSLLIEDFEEVDATKLGTIPAPIHAVEYAPNRLKVSGSGNPFRFPVEKSYSISNSAILGMMPITQALSEGQFGQFPLYVFTQEGIWSMQVGDGEVDYVTQKPISLDVCCNPHSITPLNGGILFATEYGLKLMQGATTVSLPNALEQTTTTTPLRKEFLELHFPQIASLPWDYQHFLKACKTGYNSVKSEVWFVLEGLPFAFVWQVDSNVWGIRENHFCALLNNYPHLYGVTQGEDSFHIYNISAKSQNPYPQVGFLTRPLKLGSLSRKKLSQLLVRLAGSVTQLRCALYGSNDALHDTLIAEITGDCTEVSDLEFRLHTAGFKYFSVWLVGSFSLESSLHSLELLFRNTHNKRLE